MSPSFPNIILCHISKHSALMLICYCFSLSIRNETENSIITNLTDGDNVWIGLHRDLLWSDGSTTLFTYWASGQLNASGQQCVTTLFNDSGHWFNDNCSLSFPLICYTASNVSYFCSYTNNTNSVPNTKKDILSLPLAVSERFSKGTRPPKSNQIR